VAKLNGTSWISTLRSGNRGVSSFCRSIHRRLAGAPAFHRAPHGLRSPQALPNAKLAIGPAIEDGFYYDFQVDRPFQPEDLAQIEEWMRKIAEEDHPFVRAEMNRSEAILQYKDKEEPFKVELLERIPDETVSTYTHSFFTDLCRGPHVPRTRVIKSFKLLSVAGRTGAAIPPGPCSSGSTAPRSLEGSPQGASRTARGGEERDHRKLGRSWICTASTRKPAVGSSSGIRTAPRCAA